MDERAQHHAIACDGFTRAVERIGDRPDVPTPCEEWCARDVVEHVIGFHDADVMSRLVAAHGRDPRWSPA
jgi:hypothetical protein